MQWSGHLTVSPQAESVVLLPCVSSARLGLGVAVTLLDTSGGLTSRSKTTRLTVLVDSSNDPVVLGVVANSVVLGVDEDDFVVLVTGVLVNPVRVQDTKVGATAANTLLGSSAKRSLVLELVHTHVSGLTCTQLLTSHFVENIIQYAYHKWHPCERVSCGHHV
jgi:hypothetical protein